MRQTGRLCAVPAYAFIACVGLLGAVGAWRLHEGTLTAVASPDVAASASLGWLLLLRAFASGCSALTGVEAISNCVPRFEEPARRNAKITLAILSAVLGALFLGTTGLAVALGARPVEGETVVSQLARSVFGDGAAYYAIQVSTLLVLALGANTSFVVFPELGSEIARDGYLPRLFEAPDGAGRPIGIVLLGLLASLALVAFQADPHALLPLYATGVFASFTLAQAGMARHWSARRAWPSAVANGVGAVVTGTVALLSVATSVRMGSWIILVALPGLMLGMTAIRSVRAWVAERLPLELPRA